MLGSNRIRVEIIALLLLVGFVFGYLPSTIRLDHRSKCLRAISHRSVALRIWYPPNLTDTSTASSAAKIGFETEHRQAIGLISDIVKCDQENGYKTVDITLVEDRLLQPLVLVEKTFRR